MSDAKNSKDGAPRRRSLLPKRSSTKPGSTRMEVVPEQAIHSTVRAGTYGSDPDGSKSPRPRPYQEPVKPQNLRKPNPGRPSLADTFRTSTRLKTVSSDNNSRRSTSAANVSQSHSISSSHYQVKHPVTRAFSSRTSLSAQSTKKDQKPISIAAQQPSAPKETLKSRPSSPAFHCTDTRDIASANVFHVQKELTQLHLIHLSAHSVQNLWERSAQERLQARFRNLSERHLELREIAVQQQILLDQLALVHWSQKKPGPQVAEKVALLSRLIGDVCSITDAAGKYTRVLDIFESWFAQALQTRERRKPTAGQEERNSNVIEGIGDGWKAEAMVLERELTYYLHDLKTFGLIRPDSSLGRLYSLYRKLIVNLIQEIDVIQWIENEVTISEGHGLEARMTSWPRALTTTVSQ